MGKPADPYEVLGLRKEDKPGSDLIRKAYHRLARVHHPDKARTPADREAAEVRFKEIGSAYEILSDPEKRDKYDAGGFEKEWTNPRDAEVWRSRTETGGKGSRTSRLVVYRLGEALLSSFELFRSLFLFAQPSRCLFFSPTSSKTRRLERAREESHPEFWKRPRPDSSRVA